MNIKFRKLLLLVILSSIIVNIYAQTPPIVYVSGNGTGDFNCDGTSDQIEINQAMDYIATHTDFAKVYQI